MRVDHDRFTEHRVFVTKDGKHHDTREQASAHAGQMERLVRVIALVDTMVADAEAVDEDDRGNICWYRDTLALALIKHSDAVLDALDEDDGC